MSDDGVTVTIESASMRFQMGWAAFLRFLEAPTVFMLFYGARMFLLIPKRTFSPGEGDRFREILISKIHPR
ncbi:MAG: YcxB family protein [Terriglobales bacterium]